MPTSILEAIKSGQWDYEPEDVESERFRSTPALPGSKAKLEVMAERVARGLPLWNEEDRLCYDDREDGI